MFTIAAFYQFTTLPDIVAYKEKLAALAGEQGVVGSILLAPEGVNGTIAGTRAGVDALLAALRALPGCSGLEHKESTSEHKPFKRMKVRLKKEIVTMGVDVDALNDVGAYVAPEDWNALISDPETILIDARNEYEVAIGSFDGAIDPKTSTFGELPKWLDELAAQKQSGEKKRLAMFCTGGIRCEKATAYAKKLGFDDIFHLKGGILKYLENVPETESLWRGACYVFDERVSVGHGLVEGDHVMCRAFGRPVDSNGRAHRDYREGVSCKNCINEYTEEDRARFAARHQQIIDAGRE